MERLKHMKESLMCCLEAQLNHLEDVDAQEMGEVVDMVKDLEEAMYYHTVTKAMEEKEKMGYCNLHLSLQFTDYFSFSVGKVFCSTFKNINQEL